MTNSGRSGDANSRSDGWERIRSLEDALALLIDLDEARITIKRAAWELGEAEIYRASEKQRRPIELLKTLLSERWHELFEDISGETE